MTNIFFILWLVPLICAVIIATSRNLFANIIALTGFSLAVATLFLCMGAPDVAITESAIGAAISTIFLLLALKSTKADVDAEPINKTPAKIVIIALVLLMFTVVAKLPEFGSADSVANNHVGKYYVENVMADTAIPNAVTAVLASYRGFDTMGELYVIFTAGLAVLLILPTVKKVRSKRGKK